MHKLTKVLDKHFGYNTEIKKFTKEDYPEIIAFFQAFFGTNITWLNTSTNVSIIFLTTNFVSQFVSDCCPKTKSENVFMKYYGFVSRFWLYWVLKQQLSIRFSLVRLGQFSVIFPISKMKENHKDKNSVYSASETTLQVQYRRCENVQRHSWWHQHDRSGWLLPLRWQTRDQMLKDIFIWCWLRCVDLHLLLSFRFLVPHFIIKQDFKCAACVSMHHVI